MSTLFMQYKCNISGEFVHVQVSGLNKAIQLCNVLDETKVTEVKVYSVKGTDVMTIHRHFTKGEIYPSERALKAHGDFPQQSALH